MLYALFKFVHIAAVIVWVGSMLTLTILSARSAHEDPAGAAALGRASAFFGQAVAGPAAGLALLAGIATMVTGRIPITSSWILWGFAALLLSGGMGGTVQRRAGEHLGRLLATGGPEDPAVPAARRRLARLNLLNLLILTSAVFVMVAKP
jgi:hypothetical protein